MNGIFAFAIWDDMKQRIFLARDRMGVKPLFITRTPHALLFASEIKAILKLIRTSRSRAQRERPAGTVCACAGTYTRQDAVLGHRRTEARRVHDLCSPLGTYIHRYWQYESHPHTDSLAATTEKLNELVIDATRRQLVSDVPVCTFLSGGLDSSTLSVIAAREAARTGGILRTFSVDFADNEKYFSRSVFQPNADSDYIGMMQRHIGSDHTSYIIDTQALAASLRDAMIARDLPGMADVDSSLLLFCRRIKDDATVALSGECADEIFGGYPWFYRDDLLSSDIFPWANSLALRRGVMSKSLAHLDVEGYAKSRYFDTVEETPLSGDETPEERRRRQMFYLNIKWFMANLLERKDRMSMACGLEVRVPFCDHRIAEYAWNIPWNIKNLGGMEKGILRLAVKDMLPEAIYNRKKSPYPKTHHPEYTRQVSLALKETLADPNAPIHALIDVDFIEDMLHNLSMVTPWFGQLMTGPQLFAFLLQLNMWLEEYQVRIDV